MIHLPTFLQLAATVAVIFAQSSQIFISCQAATVTLNDADINLWVNKISADLDSFRTKLGATKLETAFTDNGLVPSALTNAKASDLLRTVRGRIENFLWKNENSVKNIRIQAENSYVNYTRRNYSCSDFSTYPYLRAAAILKQQTPAPTTPPPSAAPTAAAPTAAAPAAVTSASSTAAVDYCVQEATLQLTPDPRLYGVETSRRNSTSHVPPNIYDASNEILNVANWTNKLDEVFKSNAQEDVTLKWQYFGTTEGMFKIYPGIQWYVQTRNYTQKDMPIDLFDCRTQYWYLLAATYPKDMVILIDNSGSMKGSGSIMANKTLTEILHTLSVNDYFNVVMFMNMSVKYISSAYNRTMLQATEMNKNRVMEIISNDEKKPSTKRQFAPQGVSDFRLALVEAFELLRLARNRTASGGTAASGGVQTIMLITDSAPQSFADLFQAYNPDRQIRLFTFLIGQEATDEEIVKAMACSNRGFFVQIATLADVKENVQSYIPVMARTNALSQDYFFVWTGVHQNQIKTQAMPITVKNKLFASVAQAAYDTRKIKNGVGRLIGVAGLDIPVDHFERLGPAWELGLLGYIFMVTNNGFVLFHPEFRPVNDAGHMQLFYNNRDIAEIEFPADSKPVNNRPNFSLPLRLALVQRATGYLDMTRIRLYDDMTRGIRQEFRYFYAPLNSTSPAGGDTHPTPFSLGLALPWRASGSSGDGLGAQWPPGVAYTKPAPTSTFNLSLADLSNLLSPHLSNATCNTGAPAAVYQAGLSDYEFCDFPSDLLALYNANPACALASVLAMPLSRQTALGCSQDYLNRVATDAASTRNALANWQADLDAATREQLGASGLLFLWSNSGLARWLGDPIDASYAAPRRNGSRDSLYERTALLAAESDSLGVVLTPPTGAAASSRVKANLSLPLYLTSPLRVGVGGNSSVVGVVGAELNYEQFGAYFVRATNLCVAGAGATCTTCACPNVRCYLLDGGGNVVASEDGADLGKAFDRVSCPAMRLMLNRSLFSTMEAYDFQSVCVSKTSVAASASVIFSPFRALYRLVSWALVEGFLLLSDLTSSWLQVLQTDAQAAS